MLLKSSSTPLLVSLLSLSETTPNHHSYESTNTKHPSNSPFHFHSNNNKLSFSPLLSSNSSPISPSNFSDHDRFSRKGFRRAQSEGNLSTLARVSHSLDQQVEDQDQDQDPFFFNSNIDSYKPNKFSDRPKHLMLQSIPAFSMYNSRATTEEEEEEEEDWLEDNNEISDDDTKEETVVNTSEVNHHIDVNSKIINALILTPQDTIAAKDDTWITTGFQQEAELMSQKMHLARGLGIDVIEGGSGGGGGKGKFNPGGCGGDGGEKYGNGMEEHHKNMVEQNPGNPLVLRNYAQFLYQSKGDLQGAEEYYSRAILIDSKDGEILSQYAKLVWELHHDHERASAYFHRAIQASPQDSHVHAAYANFLWETELDDDEFGEATVPLPQLDQSYMATATA